MSEFANGPVSLTYEAVANQEQRDRMDQSIARAIALQSKMGFDKSKGMGFSPYYEGWPSSAVVYAEEGTVSFHLVPLDSEGWRPVLGFAKDIKYSQATGHVGNTSTFLHLPDNINKEEQQQRLPDEAVALFDSFLDESIYSHWKFLRGKRSPEQRAEAEAQLKETRAICEDLLTASSWEPTKDSPIPSTKRRSRRFQQNDTDIRQDQYGNLVSPPRSFMQRILKIELPQELVWEDRTWIEAQVGDIHFSVLDTNRPGFSVFSYEHEFEAENFDDPSQLHIESNLVERLRKLIENKMQ